MIYSLEKEDGSISYRTAFPQVYVQIVVTSFILVPLIKIVEKLFRSDVLKVKGSMTCKWHPEVPTGMDEFKAACRQSSSTLITP